MKKYIKIMRMDHWIKQLFILPGIVLGGVLNNVPITLQMMRIIIGGFLCACLIASANYVINEWLDAEFDKYHPVKKHRTVVEHDLKKVYVYGLYILLTVAGLLLGWLWVGRMYFAGLLFLWIMGVLYNVKPFRTKDIPYIDVLTESVNNAIRLLLGWFLVTTQYYPPVSVVFGYWFAGAFLMAVKRFSEFKFINDADKAKMYRKSFAYYSAESLLISSFFYGMCSVFFLGIFLIKYRIELLLFIPVLIGLFCYYFYISFKEDSAAQRPEKLYKEKGLMLYLIVGIGIFVVLMKVNIPLLGFFESNELVPIQ